MPFNTRLLLPVALGLSVVTVTAFVAYYIFKKDEDEVKENTVKSTKTNIIEVSVPKSIVPALIGRNGSNAKDIENKTGALIHFKKFSDKELDVCVIRGRSEATQLAEAMIHEFIKQQPVFEEDTMMVPAWACGRIIGTGGENITGISHRSGARIKVESGPVGDNSSQRQISFRGTKEQIKVAKDLIETSVAQEKCRREIEQSKRAPRVAIPAPNTQSVQRPESPGRPARPSAKCRPEPLAASIEVYVSAVSSPSRFWVQFVGPQVAQLDELVAHMTEYYGNRENRKAHSLKQVSVGQVVAAVFRHDGRWYRARVHDIRPNEFDATQQVADVFFLDYGDSEYVATHELCELRADLLRLRFQAMECFLAGVKPAGEGNKWHSQAVERFEELTQVARWKPLLSKTCTHKKSIANAGDKEKEIPGIKLFDANEGETVDIAEALIAEGWAEASASPRSSPPPHQPHTPFGDLGNSRVLGMLPTARSSSLPKDHKDDRSEQDPRPESLKDMSPISPSKSLSSGLESADKLKSVSNFDLSYSEFGVPSQINGSHEEFLNKERNNITKESEVTSVPSSPTLKLRDEFKANMNRIDSHHSNLDSLARNQH